MQVDLSVRDWVAAWGAQVAAVDLATARARFDDDVVGFGTFAGVVHGLDALHDDQWSNVWPTIADFRFLVDEMVTLVSADGCQAVAVVPWTSTGFDGDGAAFARPGRATIVLRRADADASWFGVHTHFSLVPTPAVP